MFATQEMLKRCFRTCIIVVVIGFAIIGRGQNSKENQNGATQTLKELITEKTQPAGRSRKQKTTQTMANTFSAPW
jgi:hypothetical protein